MCDSPKIVTMETLSEDNCLKVSSPIQNVARQDSGVPEDLASPINDDVQPLNEEDPDLTMNSECNITVIHITESVTDKTNEKSLSENKDSKDGSDSGVEGCATEVSRVSCNTRHIICERSITQAFSNIRTIQRYTYINKFLYFWTSQNYTCQIHDF